jgi:hypothetical protein
MIFELGVRGRCGINVLPPSKVLGRTGSPQGIIIGFEGCGKEDVKEVTDVEDGEMRLGNERVAEDVWIGQNERT